MQKTTADVNRTARLLALFKQGDSAFNARNQAGMDAVHHPDMIAHIRDTQNQSMARLLTPRLCSSSLRSSPTFACTTTHTESSSEAATGLLPSLAQRAHSPARWFCPMGKWFLPRERPSTSPTLCKS